MSWFGGKKKQKLKEYSGFPGDCSEQQLATLDKFKIHVKQYNKVPIEQFDDIYLLRFLRARKFDLPKTIKMWDDFINWRLSHNIDNCRNFKFPALPELRKMYPHGYHKVDKQFRPIYIERVGFMEVDKIFKVMQTQDMLNYYALLYETLLTTIFEGCTNAKQMVTGEYNKVSQTITILDLKHVKLGNASKAYDFVKPVSAMAQNNYPEILGNMFIINAPMLFTGIWAIVKMWIDDKTKQKIKILGSSYKKELLQYIEPENLPAFLDGGKCTCGGKQCKLEANVGPWNPEGKEMFAQNINLIKEEKKDQQSHKQQILLSSPDVIVEVQVKNDSKNQVPPVVTLSMQHGAQQDQVLKKVAQIDMGKDKEQEKISTKQQPAKESGQTETTQTEKKLQEKVQKVEEITQTEQNLQKTQGKGQITEGTQTQQKEEKKVQIEQKQQKEEEKAQTEQKEEKEEEKAQTEQKEEKQVQIEENREKEEKKAQTEEKKEIKAQNEQKKVTEAS